MIDKNYTPGRDELMPVNMVNDWAKVRRIIRAVRNGQSVPAIVYDGDLLLNGSHRQAANDLIDMLAERRNIPAYKVDHVSYRDVEELENAEDLRELASNDQFDIIDDWLDRK